MDTIDPARFIFASFFVLGLLGLLAVVLKHYGQKPLTQKIFGTKLLSMNQGAARVSVVETRHIDNRTKLLLVRRDEVEHLLLIGNTGVTIVESAIQCGEGSEEKTETGHDA